MGMLFSAIGRANRPRRRAATQVGAVLVSCLIPFCVGAILITPSAQAQTACGPLTTFVNGQTADAAQVNGNFSALLNCVNGLISAGTFPNIVTFSNLKVTNVGTTTPNVQVSVIADRISLVGSSSGLLAAPVSLTISTATNGANGLDAATAAVSTWYAVYVISNGTTTAGLLSTSATAPVMPSGYTFKARVGWVRTDASINLLRTLQLGRVARYVITPSTNTPTYPQLVSSSQGNSAAIPPTYVAFAVAPVAPSTASAVMLLAGSTSLSNTLGIAAPNANYGSYSAGINSSPPPPPLIGGTPGNPISIVTMLLESPNIYAATQSSALILCGGWEDNL